MQPVSQRKSAHNTHGKCPSSRKTKSPDRKNEMKIARDVNRCNHKYYETRTCETMTF